MSDFLLALPEYAESEYRRLLVGKLVTALTGEHRLYSFRYAENIHFRELHDRWYGEPRKGDIARIVLLAVVGSVSTSEAAWQSGSWPAGVNLFCDNGDRITGCGGNGGKGGNLNPGGTSGTQENGSPGQAGGLALLVEAPVNFYNVSGVIAGGGGGGGGGPSTDNFGGFAGGGGGGGAGRNAGSGGARGEDLTGAVPKDHGNPGDAGTLTAGGQGGAGRVSGLSGGLGGAPGQAGFAGDDTSSSASAGAGGAAGAAISGLSNITFVDANGDPTMDQGTILGPTS